jgi:nitrate reductase NapE component
VKISYGLLSSCNYSGELGLKNVNQANESNCGMATDLGTLIDPEKRRKELRQTELLAFVIFRFVVCLLGFISWLYKMWLIHASAKAGVIGQLDAGLFFPAPNNKAF